MFARILFGTDFSKEALEVEQTVAELAERFGSAVVAFHAIEPIDPGGDQGPYEGFYRSLATSATQKMEALARRFSERKLACEAHVAVGPRWREIVDEAARTGADLIVLGSRPRDQLVAGSTGHQVFLASSIPVLFVRRGGAS